MTYLSVTLHHLPHAKGIHQGLGSRAASLRSSLMELVLGHQNYMITPIFAIIKNPTPTEYSNCVTVLDTQSLNLNKNKDCSLLHTGLGLLVGFGGTLWSEHDIWGLIWDPPNTPGALSCVAFSQSVSFLCLFFIFCLSVLNPSVNVSESLKACWWSDWTWKRITCGYPRRCSRAHLYGNESLWLIWVPGMDPYVWDKIPLVSAKGRMGCTHILTWSWCLWFSFASMCQENSILFYMCTVYCFVLFILFLTYETDTMEHTQSLSLMTLILGHLQDFRNRTRSIEFETKKWCIFLKQMKQPLLTLNISLKRDSLSP